MPKWTDYTIKTNPVDKDEVMILDTAGKANKRLGLSALSDWIIGKIANKVFENLQTQNKTILGAINELNSNSAFRKHIMLGNSKNTIKITPSTSYQLFFVYGYRSNPWMGVIVSEGKVSGFKFEKVGSETVSVETSGENSLILKYSQIWGQAAISSKYAFSYELLQL